MELTAANCQEILTSNILPFWMKRMVDHQHGGFYGSIDASGILQPKAPKAIILNTRILWTFSAAYQQFGDEPYRDIASRAVDYLISRFVDKKEGGVYWMLDHLGEPLESKKQIYAQAFAIYALSQFHHATQDQQALDIAQQIFALVEHHSFDSLNNGYLEAFDRQWNLLEDLRLSHKDANEAKTMNTHLHILEAYSKLYQVWPEAKLAKQLENLIHLFLDRFIGQTGYFNLFFDEKWNLKSSIQSYGHDIEGGWLLLRAAEILGNNLLIDKCKNAAVSLTEVALRGMDTDGGLMYEGDAGGVINPDKHWWPQAEALVGLINALQITEDNKYLVLAEKNWQFIKNHLVDSEGEWHGILRSDGSIDLQEEKAGPWKAPYHNGRAMIELMNRL